MRKVAIIIPTSNNLKQLETAVSSFMNSTDYEDYRFIIIESESTDGTKEYCDYMQKKLGIEKFRVYHTKKEGSIKACNFGINQTNANEDVLLTQDDMLFFKLYKRDWLVEMIRTSQLEGAGAVTILNGGGRSGPDYLEGLTWAGTWCLYLPRKTIEKVGLFDEQFKIGEDIDYSYRIYQSGLNIVHINVWFDHHMFRETSHQPQDEELKKKNAQLFRRKHGLK